VATLWRRLTGRFRVLPDFVIIGAQKGGTSSLYEYLIRHPWVAPCVHKEVHFFDLNVHYRSGPRWYRSHFVSSAYRARLERARGHRLVTGEATPYYLFHPHVPERVFKIVPGVKLIALLRNPVDRAYSHYHHEVQRGREPLSFEAAIRAEEERTGQEKEKILRDEGYDSFEHIHFTYLARSVYVDQLQAWEKWFPRDQMLVLQTERFSADPAGGLRQVLDFLGLPRWEPAEYRRHNVGRYEPMSARTRRRLVAHFAPHNQRLWAYLGRTFDWDR